MERKNIYVAYTGGTIGMKKSAQGYVPAAGHLSQCVENLPEFFRDEMPRFDIHEYTPLMDSSDMTPSDWVRIARDIERNYHQYDGFVILHGTDTMAYTASALSFMLQDLSKPVIVTGSQIPLSALRSDGQINLLNALYIAANYPINEVSLFFNNTLFRGNRATKADANGFNAFSSPNYPSLLEAGIQIKLNAGELGKPPTVPMSVAEMTPQPIGVVMLYPGISAKLIDNMMQQPVKALIIQSYGVGNAPQDKQLLDSFKRGIDQGIIIVNCTQCFKGRVNMDGYATGNALAQLGIVSGSDMTIEAALTKLHYLLSQNLSRQAIIEHITTDLRGELTQ
ncbi:MULTISPECIES: asparaginase [Idiomarina]|uniref:L-asparaginase 1 n=2 Tax=Idiomarina baltica TaxID=190892 RepID=A0A348WPJ1_9GAMM|nr:MULTISPECIES: asparaginase [Idiomarina]MAF75350.1 L-asparaginase 1 [Idiomarinaceae bacterium]MEC8924829.1 asparaginase [Pseudomonadota bacterium]EAQ30888.1 L-asparaginase I [Idiomarina baltica OS145]HAE90626.1 L-asparaginase 1 [Idiomarina sp.]HAR56453.1 L-asparaginase 1 [Idiomarina baltica]